MSAVPSVQERILSMLTDRGWTVATGESVTAGQVCAALADVPGASTALRGGIVAYQSEVKHRVLGIPQEVIAAGLVTADVAIGLAVGARQALRADVGIGTTGAAGPSPHDGAEPGTAWVAVALPGGEPRADLVRLTGDRSDVRAGTTHAALALAAEALAEAGPGRE